MSVSISAFRVTGVPELTLQADPAGSAPWVTLNLQNAGDSVHIAFNESVWRTINEDLTALFAKIDAETVLPEPDESWIQTGGYSPNGNSFVCPVDGCGWGVSGLNAPPDPDDAYTVGDPVAEHYAESHANVQLAVDQAGTVMPALEGVQPR